MSKRIHRGLKPLGLLGLTMLGGFVLASPFLPLSPFWHQAMIGVVMIGFYLATLLGPTMSYKVKVLRQKRGETMNNTRTYAGSKAARENHWQRDHS